MDFALNNLQMLICHKTHRTKPNQTKTLFIIMIYNQDMYSSFKIQMMILCFPHILTVTPLIQYWYTANNSHLLSCDITAERQSGK